MYKTLSKAFLLALAVTTPGHSTQAIQSHAVPSNAVLIGSVAIPTIDHPLVRNRPLGIEAGYYTARDDLSNVSCYVSIMPGDKKASMQILSKGDVGISKAFNNLRPNHDASAFFVNLNPEDTARFLEKEINGTEKVTYDLETQRCVMTKSNASDVITFPAKLEYF